MSGNQVLTRGWLKEETDSILEWVNRKALSIAGDLVRRQMVHIIEEDSDNKQRTIALCFVAFFTYGFQKV